jgi:hypothetical protein
MAANSMGYLQIDIPQINRNIASFGPTLSAIIISLIVYGRDGLRRTLNGLGTWRLNPVWYLLIFLGSSIVGLIAIGINSSLGGTIPSFFQFCPFSMLPVIFLYVLILGGTLGEEIGWRGYALQRLSRKPGRIMGTLLLGFLWGVWHLPLFFIEGSPQAAVPFPVFLVQTTCLSVVHSWLFYNTGSVLIALLFHASNNTTAGILPVLPLPETGGTIQIYYIFNALLVIISVILLTKSDTFNGKT